MESIAPVEIASYTHSLVCQLVGISDRKQRKKMQKILRLEKRDVVVEYRLLFFFLTLCQHRCTIHLVVNEESFSDVLEGFESLWRTIMKEVVRVKKTKAVESKAAFVYMAKVLQNVTSQTSEALPLLDEYDGIRRFSERAWKIITGKDAVDPFAVADLAELIVVYLNNYQSFIIESTGLVWEDWQSEA